MATWTLEKAKNHFSEVVRRALAHQPQEVTRGGRDAVIVVAKSDYERLLAPVGLVEFMRGSPLVAAVARGEIDLERDRDPGRDIDL
ncbi:MAG: type II toxin-antitoxin system prevent-host-death family antitoxin [Gemmatimonadaceae bacterium]